MSDALSTTLASLSDDFHAARTELLDMLRRRGILYRSPTQPILSRDGASARWMLDSLSVTLSPAGAGLAGRCILKLLERFDGHQIATYGLTGVPILQSCLLQSGGRYRGLLIRKERKQHGSLKLIEGEIDEHEPVIVIDDSISSGTCMGEAIERMEEAGLRVEGGVCLVRFGWYGGFALMQQRGYHMEAVYDIWDDFISAMEDEEKPLANPSKWFPEYRWSLHQAPDYLHPAKLARLVISEYVSSGELLRPPGDLDAEYDSSGGAWVSVRSQSNIHQRYARDGYWHFPGEQNGSAAEDVVLASLRTAYELPRGGEGLQILNQSGIAVTFFSALEKCTPGELNNDRYGIVVRSLERRQKMGGALPRMPGIRNEWEQFQHARIKNAQLVSFEPYELFRHEVVKAVEPEMHWQPTGVAKGETLRWYEDRTMCGVVAERARDLVLAQLFNRPETTVKLPDDLFPAELDSIYLTIYINGHLRGCMGSVVRSLDDDLKRFVDAALHDERFAEAVVHDDRSAIDRPEAQSSDERSPSLEDQQTDAASMAVSVSFLFNPLEMGAMLPEEVGPYYRHGEQTLMVYRGNNFGLLLPFVASMYNYDRRAFAEAVRQKSGLVEPPYYWCRFDCATWLADGEGVWPTIGGFPLLTGSAGVSPASTIISSSSEVVLSLTRYASLHARYLINHLKPDGTFYSGYDSFQNRLYEGIDLPWLAHGAWVLARAHKILGGDDLKDAADRVINYLLSTVSASGEEIRLKSGDEPSSVAEISFLLLSLCELEENDPRRSMIERLESTLWSSIDHHGRIQTHRQVGAGDNSSDAPGRNAAKTHLALDAFQDYFPGQVLLALATATEHATASESFTYQVQSTRHQAQRPKTKDQRPNDSDKLRRTFQYYRHRFRYKRHFGQVSWLLQAFSKWWCVTHEPYFSELVFEIADWVLEYQQEKTGAFINDHQADSPGYTTALYLEGLAAATGVAASVVTSSVGTTSAGLSYPAAASMAPSSVNSLGTSPLGETLLKTSPRTSPVEESSVGVASEMSSLDPETSSIGMVAFGRFFLDQARYKRYCNSFAEGFRFLDRLIIQERDKSILPNADLALGGLRQGLYYSHIRTDFVQHSLSALIEFISHQLYVKECRATGLGRC